uniref:Carbonic anhydrase n=1 Tax=Cuerna arida TaxID=1464854 RepID=A0A1B6F3B4_9HEMI
MAVTDNQNEDVEQKKVTFKKVAQKEGKCPSPIDLATSVMKPLYLDRLDWINLDSAPRAMKLTNSGDTLVITAKWATEVPYLVNGPLDGSYTFSQAHFHWGSHEGEGSEHTIDGMSYPMEMHLVFFKSQYLTPESALQKNDGIVIIAYLVKLEEESTLSLQWLSSHLDKILEPQTSTMLPPFPLSSLVVPVMQDYALYWGSLDLVVCSHTIQWIVSRAALAISIEDLMKFRRMLNIKREPIVQNFQRSGSATGRTIFHVNPFVETEHFLFPRSLLLPIQAQGLNEIFKSNDYPVDLNHITGEEEKMLRERELLDSKYLIDDSIGSILAHSLKKTVRDFSDEWNTSIESCSFKSSDSNSPTHPQQRSGDKEPIRLRKQNHSRGVRTKKLANEKERRQELEKNRLKMLRKNEESSGQRVHKLGIKSIGLINKSMLTAKVGQTCIIQQSQESENNVQKNIVDTGIDDETLNRKVENGNKNTETFKEKDVVHALNLTKACTQLLPEKYDSTVCQPNISEIGNDNIDLNDHKKCNVEKEKPVTKSKLPRPVQRNKQVIQSSLVKYFTKYPNENKQQSQLKNLNMSETEKNTKTSFPISNQDQVKQPKQKFCQRSQAVSPKICIKHTDTCETKN